jgi:hypothetical protein
MHAHTHTHTHTLMHTEHSARVRGWQLLAAPRQLYLRINILSMRILHLLSLPPVLRRAPCSRLSTLQPLLLLLEVVE